MTVRMEWVFEGFSVGPSVGFVCPFMRYFCASFMGLYRRVGEEFWRGTRLGKGERNVK